MAISSPSFFWGGGEAAARVMASSEADSTRATTPEKKCRGLPHFFSFWVRGWGVQRFFVRRPGRWRTSWVGWGGGFPPMGKGLASSSSSSSVCCILSRVMEVMGRDVGNRVHGGCLSVAETDEGEEDKAFTSGGKSSSSDSSCRSICSTSSSDTADTPSSSRTSTISSNRARRRGSACRT